AAFADAAAWLPRGASYGDDDEGRALTLGGEDDYVSSVALAIHGFLQQPGLTASPQHFRAIIFGRPSHATPQPTGLKTFEQGGLSIWRGDINGCLVELTFDHGPLGYLSIAAHGHADALAITLVVDGEPVLVDPGTYLYGSGGKWRDWFRSTPAHNTLNILSTSQSVMSGKFNWSHKAAATLTDARPEPDWSLCAQHDGYKNRFGAVHQRTVERCGKGIQLRDHLLGTACNAEIVFQLADGLTIRQTGNRMTIFRAGEPIVSLDLPDGTIECRAGGDHPGEGGWVSQRFGERRPASRIAWRGKVDDAGVVSLIEIVAPADGVNEA
ncbi:heparinase II/III-family protein, partial [Tianweitania sp.]|uniref:heparinase II/III family protein n=1 Tax=Tianweitania sp. TaxID=2021634 RepID=UPI00289DFE1D